MIGKEVRKVRADDVLQYLLQNNDGLVFLTLTTPDVCTLSQIRQRWRSFRHWLVESYGSDVKYIMNYELHPGGHGWHIHGVFNRYIRLRGDGLARIQLYGFGRVNVKKVKNEFVSEYLVKHCLKAYKPVRDSLGTNFQRLRLVNCSRGLPCLSHYHWCSQFGDKVKAVFNSANSKNVFDKVPRHFRLKYCELAVLFGVSAARMRIMLHRIRHESYRFTFQPEFDIMRSRKLRE